jgi:hypothetical protein
MLLLMQLQPEDLQLYDAAFSGLYHSSSKKNKVRTSCFRGLPSPAIAQTSITAAMSPQDICCRVACAPGSKPFGPITPCITHVNTSDASKNLLSRESVQVQRLQTALAWHLAHGMLQGPAILQNLLKLAAEDGNATVMNLLLPLFARHGWLVSGRGSSEGAIYIQSLVCISMLWLCSAGSPSPAAWCPSSCAASHACQENASLQPHALTACCRCT